MQAKTQRPEDQGLTGLQWDIMLTPEEMERLTAPCVYAWIRNSEFLYIGATITGILRPLSHNLIGKIEPMLPTDEIRLYRFRGSHQELHRYEEAVILKHKPKYNAWMGKFGWPLGIINCVKCNAEFRQKHSKTIFCEDCNIW